jgi:hypothetical protein
MQIVSYDAQADNTRTREAVERELRHRDKEDDIEVRRSRGLRLVCENHPDRPWEGANACTCAGAGAPCPDPGGTNGATRPAEYFPPATAPMCGLLLPAAIPILLAVVSKPRIYSAISQSTRCRRLALGIASILAIAGNSGVVALQAVWKLSR